MQLEPFMIIPNVQSDLSFYHIIQEKFSTVQIKSINYKGQIKSGSIKG